MAESMRDLIRAAAKVQRILIKERLKFCFIGGLAVQKWGQVRITQDIDLTVLTAFGTEGGVIDTLLNHFTARIDDARNFALNNRVLLLVTATGIGLDISFGAFPFEESAIARATKVEVIKGHKLILCTAEDLIVYKAFADRPLDWADVEGIIVKQSSAKIDWDYVFANLNQLAELKEDAQIVPKLMQLRKSIKT